MIGLDTNVLVRYLAGDPESEAQVIQAVKRIDHALHEGVAIFVNNVVLCETVWVLLYHYNIPQKKLITALEVIIRHPGFLFESRHTLEKTLELYQQKKADFADCLIFLLNKEQGCKETLSFDKQAIRGLNFREP